MQIFTQLKAGTHSCFYIAPTYPSVISLEDELKGTSHIFKSICHISKQKNLLYTLPCHLKLGDKLFNSVVLAENGKLIGTSDMTHGDNKYSLSSSFVIHDTRYGKVGVLIDDDVSYFECGRILSLMGAEILLCIGGNRRMAHSQCVSNGMIGIYYHGGKVTVYNSLYQKIPDGVRITSLMPLTPRPIHRRPSLYSILSSDNVDEVRNMSVYSPNDFVK
ncbi:MAG: hypothetical protein IKD20_00745 [Clostridia bacterium]|nr:hypothetical protein [Clostridia bacterium]